MVWTDQAKIEFFDLNHQKQKAFEEKNTLPTIKHRGGSIMLWRCVAASDMGHIVHVEGRMD